MSAVPKLAGLHYKRDEARDKSEQENRIAEKGTEARDSSAYLQGIVARSGRRTRTRVIW